ncbi:MAG: TIGR02757 family protein [Deltaproteobacteria bacterium]|nr:TIGR02757 family protein [Deltaproteobacteria bacterium]MBW1960535.1 TIGR02757 family protein [Deltaproteobacteria bacterium]MBW2150674.1 TIGR02757 family protein [Deltaproteobacteria bacterium]
MHDELIKTKLDALYDAYNNPAYIHPDPLEFLFNYRNLEDREIVAIIAAALAYGRVNQILKSVRRVLQIMGPAPLGYLKNASAESLQEHFAGFAHRFASAKNLCAFLLALKQLIQNHGSLYECFLSGYSRKDDTVLPALIEFSRKLHGMDNLTPGHLVARPEKGSACKRLNLFLRWMIRTDAVDPGGWDEVQASKLIVPLDVHMHRSGILLGFTRRKQADMRTVLEITAGFRRIAPEDPVKYDFALTRLGILKETDLESYLRSA